MFDVFHGETSWGSEEKRRKNPQSHEVHATAVEREERRENETKNAFQTRRACLEGDGRKGEKKKNGLGVSGCPKIFSVIGFLR
jgi:hypothetical protein